MSFDRSSVRCTLCNSGDVQELLQRSSVPIHQNLVFASAVEAQSCPRGEYRLCLCLQCGMLFNDAFDESLMAYGPGYENSQMGSAAIQSYVAPLADEIVLEHPEPGRFVEVGCGDGSFIRLLASRMSTTHTALGLDPSYSGPTTDTNGRLQFERDLLTGAEPRWTGDVALARHVIEHVRSPVEFLIALRELVRSSPRGKVYVETPCADWILNSGAFWDLYYEHCSYFSVAPLVYAFARADLLVQNVARVFGEQYLWLSATPGAGPVRPQDTDALVERARSFARDYPETIVQHARRLDTLRRRGPVAVWGAGAKGVTYVHTLDPLTTRIACLIDVNPRKQGAYVAGTAHPIISPDRIVAHGITSVIVMNPNYINEVREAVQEMPRRISVEHVALP